MARKEATNLHSLRKTQTIHHGEINDVALAKLYSTTDLFVSTSRDEGFGLPAAEALASGCPVLYADNAATREVVGPYGIAFPVGDSISCAQALDSAATGTLTSDQGLFEGRQWARQKYGKDAVSAMWKGLLHD